MCRTADRPCAMPFAVDVDVASDGGKRRRGWSRRNTDDDVDGERQTVRDVVQQRRQSADDGHTQPERQGHGVRRTRSDRRPGRRDRERTSPGLSTACSLLHLCFYVRYYTARSSWWCRKFCRRDETSHLLSWRCRFTLRNSLTILQGCSCWTELRGNRIGVVQKSRGSRVAVVTTAS